MANDRLKFIVIFRSCKTFLKIVYLFHNYGWKHHPAFTNIMVLEFPPEDDDSHITEAMGVYHELWKLRLDLPSLKRSLGLI